MASGSNRHSLKDTREYKRLLWYRRRKNNWKLWGPYLSERAWGTVREDYSADGNAWDSFPHDAARSRVYRWNEDGLGGFSDRNQFLCLSLALWNHADPILKERLFGLSGPEGNHGEDVKEYYYYLRGTPTHSYMQMLYRYPQQAYPYAQLVRANAHRTVYDAEYELWDTGIFAENRYFDVYVTYFKVAEDDVLGRIDVVNRGPEVAPCTVLPQVWFRNTWSWGYEAGPMGHVPQAPRLRRLAEPPANTVALQVEHEVLGEYFFYARAADDLLFTENETNFQHLYDEPNASPWVKDAFHRYIVNAEHDAVNAAGEGTKAAAVYALTVVPGQTQTITFRLAKQPKAVPFRNFERFYHTRKQEAKAFYAALQRSDLDEEAQEVQLQAYAGLMWSKQLYYFDVGQWMDGDPIGPPPPAERKRGRNQDWRHLHNFDLVSMPDTWEYPWYAVWDLAFHCIPYTRLDADFAKRQLQLITREWYIHPNGQLPAYEWSFSDVNPPVHAWAAWRVFRTDENMQGKADIDFLKGIFHKLLLNFTWWVNRKDVDGNNVFQGGFLGLDNISLFDRSSPLPGGGHLDQADGTSWMGFYALEMMKIALRLAREDKVYLDMATKFYEHFLRIAAAINGYNETGLNLWNEEDGFYYDVLHLPDGTVQPLHIRSLVGLIPLLAAESLNHELFEEHPDFERRVRWFNQYRPLLAGTIHTIDVEGHGEHNLISLVAPDRLRRVLHYMLDEEEFLSPYGIRSLSRIHRDRPYTLMLEGHVFGIGYEPGESRSQLFGGNSNWRGPIWFPLNYLLIEALLRYHAFLGTEFTVECPTGSGQYMNLQEVAQEVAQRLIRLFRRDSQGHRPFLGDNVAFQSDPAWQNHLLFHEYFHGDTGAGLGASHQTGWTSLVIELLENV